MNRITWLKLTVAMLKDAGALTVLALHYRTTWAGARKVQDTELAVRALAGCSAAQATDHVAWWVDRAYCTGRTLTDGLGAAHTDAALGFGPRATEEFWHGVDDQYRTMSEELGWAAAPWTGIEPAGGWVTGPPPGDGELYWLSEGETYYRDDL